MRRSRSTFRSGRAFDRRPNPVRRPVASAEPGDKAATPALVQAAYAAAMAIGARPGRPARGGTPGSGDPYRAPDPRGAPVHPGAGPGPGDRALRQTARRRIVGRPVA